jgi:hypothetical protein
MDESKTTCAVIMGDLVASERLHDPSALHIRFNAHVTAQNAASAAQMISPLTITLGDEFQGLAATMADALPIMRALRHRFLSDDIDCRFVIGLADIQSPINHSNAWNMMGPGLSRARDKLNEKDTATLYRFSLPDSPNLERLLDAVGMGLTIIENGWTPRQRGDIIAQLGNHSAKDIAQARNVSVHSIYKVRASGHFEAYRAQWEAVAAMLGQIDSEKGLTNWP